MVLTPFFPSLMCLMYRLVVTMPLNPLVGRCRLTLSKPVSKAPTVSALEARISPEGGVFIHLLNLKISGREDPRVRDRSIEDSEPLSGIAFNFKLRRYPLAGPQFVLNAVHILAVPLAYALLFCKLWNDLGGIPWWIVAVIPSVVLLREVVDHVYCIVVEMPKSVGPGGMLSLLPKFPMLNSPNAAYYAGIIDLPDMPKVMPAYTALTLQVGI